MLNLILSFLGFVIDLLLLEKRRIFMKQQLTSTQRFLMGITLFSMFFGAGNLIFPPFTGYAAGTDTLLAFMGLVLTAVIFPILGIIAAVRVGSMDGLCEKIHPKFAIIFTTIIYLCIGPLLAIPRTASTSYSMFHFLIAPVKDILFLNTPLVWWIGAIFSLLFFSASYHFAQNPTVLKNVLGKYMTPILLVLVCILFVAGIIQFQQPAALARPPYDYNPFGTGFEEGYQTMDVLAAMILGLVLTLNIRDFGIQGNQEIKREVNYSCIIAGILLTIIYGMLAFLGAKASALVPNAENGTTVLSAVCNLLFGQIGPVILAIIFFVACFNVCTSLLSSCATFFHKQFPKLSFLVWLRIFAIFSFFISIMGLQTILQISAPILTFLYPVALIIIVLNLLPGSFFQKPIVHRFCVLAAFLYSVVSFL